MLPELLNIIGGTSVFGGTPTSLASGQASRPQVSSSRKPPSARGANAARSNDFPAIAAKTSAGTKTSMLRRLATAISGLWRRA
jgi:hypothetical protein